MSTNIVRDARVRTTLEMLRQIERTVLEARVDCNISDMPDYAVVNAIRENGLQEHLNNAVAIFCAITISMDK